MSNPDFYLKGGERLMFDIKDLLMAGIVIVAVVTIVVVAVWFERLKWRLVSKLRIWGRNG